MFRVRRLTSPSYHQLVRLDRNSCKGILQCSRFDIRLYRSQQFSWFDCILPISVVINLGETDLGGIPQHFEFHAWLSWLTLNFSVHLNPVLRDFRGPINFICHEWNSFLSKIGNKRKPLVGTENEYLLWVEFLWEAGPLESIRKSYLFRYELSALCDCTYFHYLLLRLPNRHHYLES